MPKPKKAAGKRRALLSVSDKTGIEAFAKALVEGGYEILSTGGTAEALRKAKIPVRDVSEITGFPEAFGGRVKTMHPMIMGGILFRREEKKDVEEAKKLGIEPIDLVCVNLYPFEETVKRLEGLKVGRFEGESQTSKPTNLQTSVLEQIDIGGPTLLRSAAKNFSSVTVLCDPKDYDRVVSEIKKSGETPLELRRELAGKVFARTAEYDSAIEEYFSGGTSSVLLLKNGRTLRYGENPHQWGKFYEFPHPRPLPRGGRGDVSSDPSSPIGGRGREMRETWKQLQGKELSYLNILDSDAAWRMVAEFSDPTAVFVKHANPSGVASYENIEDAFQRAYDADKLSAFGVIIAINRPCSEAIAKKILDQKMFVEMILAPSFEKSTLALLKQKENVRLLEMDGVHFGSDTLYRSAFGGMLAQNDDLKEISEKDLKVVTKKKPTKREIDDLLFAWKVVKHAKSNAIVLAKNHCTVGIGAGQTSRVDSTWIAVRRAGGKVKGSVMASDAFFPFPDAIEEAGKQGVSAIIQPGGSIRDEEVFKRADELEIAMVTTGIRAFRH